MFEVNNCLNEMNRIYEGYESSSENCISKLRLCLIIPIKLNETLIDSCGVFRFPGPSEASFYEITFGWKPVRQEKRSNFQSFHSPYRFCSFHINNN